MFFFGKKRREEILKKIYSRTRIVRYLEFILGTLIVAVSFNILILPNNIVYGVSGVAVIFKQLFSWDPAIVIFVGSVLLLVLSYFTLGFDKTKNSIMGSLLYPVFVKFTASLSHIEIFKAVDSDPLLLAIFGALFTGFGLGLIFKAGFTTGGTDILNQIVAKYGKISLGNSMFFTDGVIIVSGIFIPGFGPTKVMISLITLYIISIMTDKVVLGISKSKAFYIVTSEPGEVKKYILENISHGVTIMDARGGYSNDREKMIMCVVPTSMYFRLKEGLNYIDPHSFFVVTDAYETFGGSLNKQ